MAKIALSVTTTAACFKRGSVFDPPVLKCRRRHVRVDLFGVVWSTGNTRSVEQSVSSTHFSGREGQRPFPPGADFNRNPGVQIFMPKVRFVFRYICISRYRRLWSPPSVRSVPRRLCASQRIHFYRTGEPLSARRVLRLPLGYFLIFRLCFGLPNRRFPSGFRTAFIDPPSLATGPCPTLPCRRTLSYRLCLWSNGSTSYNAVFHSSHTRIGLNVSVNCLLRVLRGCHISPHIWSWIRLFTVQYFHYFISSSVSILHSSLIWPLNDNIISSVPHYLPTFNTSVFIFCVFPITFSSMTSYGTGDEARFWLRIRPTRIGRI